MRYLAFAACLLVAPRLPAQSDEAGVGLLQGFAGGAFGLGAHPAAGFNFSVATSKYTLVSAGFAYLPLGGNVLRPPLAATGLTRSRLYDINAEGQVRIPVSDRLAPYLAAGAGLLRSTSEVVAVERATQAVVVDAARNDAAFHAGIGLRYYITGNVGLQPEVRLYAGPRTFARAAVGIFYQFP